MPTLKAAAATVEITWDPQMVIGGGITPSYCFRQEAPLRASAVLVAGDQSICLVSCDVLGLTRELCDEAARGVAAACDLPFENVLIAATHTHHAPTTLSVHGYERDHTFCRRTVSAVVAAARQARARLEEAADKPNEVEAELLYALGQEATIGQNSRWLMDDGQISWTGHDPACMVRPTGPHDPDLPVLALRRPCSGLETASAGPLVAAIFCHATHNIGTRQPGAVCSPGVFGLAARDLEAKHGGPFLFFPGAFGSSHRLDQPDPTEAVMRLVSAVDEALSRLRPALFGPVLSLKRPFTCRYRQFDEAQAAEDVRRWCDRWFSPETSRTTQQVFAARRAQLQAVSGEEFETWLQVIRLGEVAIVGIPGELFASLGLAIRRRSPFRHTIVVGIANDEVGYIPDRQAYALGGYQVWPGTHSVLQEGTGEAMVEAAVGLLHEAWRGTPSREATVTRLEITDALALQKFYNRLSTRARWLFRPLGWNTTLADCTQICEDAAAGRRYDVVLRAGEEIVGWAFLVDLESDAPTLGIAVAEGWRGGGLGRQLMECLIREARQRGKRAIVLTHVKDNQRAGALYRKLGFVVTGEHRGSDGNDYWQMRLDLARDATGAPR